MRFFIKALVGFLVAWSAASLSSQAQGGGGATVITYAGQSEGLLYVNGAAPVPYTGGVINGASSVSLFNSSTTGTLSNLGTVMRTGSTPLTLTMDTTTTVPTFDLAAGTTFISGGTLTLDSGSTVSFSGGLNMSGGLTIDSGSTLVTNANSYLASGVIVNAGLATTLSSSGVVNLGVNSVINSGGTLNLGLNSGVINGVLNVGTGATLQTGGVVTLGAGSTITSGTSTVSITGLTFTGLAPSGSLLLTNATTNLTYGVTNAVSLGSGLVITGLDTNPITNPLTGGQLTINAPATLTIPASGVFPFPVSDIGLPVSTQLTVNLPAGTAFKAIPAIRGLTSSTMGTVSTLLDGVDTNGGSVSMLYLPAIQNLASDALSLHVSEFATPGQNEKFVLQMSFNPTTAAALGNLLNLYLAWYNPADSAWENAVTGNSDGGANAQFVAGAYDPTADFVLGDYGVDTTNSTVWAVIDHDGTFGVANSAVAPDALATLGSSAESLAQPLSIPEPATAALLLCGLPLLGRRRRK